MSRLSKTEREIRKSAGIPVSRWWPFVAVLLAAMIMSVDDESIRRCTRLSVPSGGRAGALVRLVLAIPCSPVYAQSSIFHFVVAVGFWASVVFAGLSVFWIRRHQAYWNSVRAREMLRRGKVRAQRIEREAGDQPGRPK